MQVPRTQKRFLVAAGVGLAIAAAVALAAVRPTARPDDATASTDPSRQLSLLPITPAPPGPIETVAPPVEEPGTVGEAKRGWARAAGSDPTADATIGFGIAIAVGRGGSCPGGRGRGWFPPHHFETAGR